MILDADPQYSNKLLTSLNKQPIKLPAASQSTILEADFKLIAEGMDLSKNFKLKKYFYGIFTIGTEIQYTGRFEREVRI